MLIIFPQVFTAVKSAITEWSMTAEAKALLGNNIPTCGNTYSQKASTFPFITVEEKINVFAECETDSTEKFSKLMYEINIYDNTVKRMQLAYAISSVTNQVLTRKFGFKRINNEPIANVADAQVYRILQRFDGFIDNESSVIYKKFH